MNELLLHLRLSNARFDEGFKSIRLWRPLESTHKPILIFTWRFRLLAMQVLSALEKSSGQLFTKG